MAENLERDLAMVGIKITPENPFIQSVPLLKTMRPLSPYVARVEALWLQCRSAIIQIFPEMPKVTKPIDEYLHNIEDIYQSDAYNSLSIEGYQVTPELIERVKNNSWNPAQYRADLEQRNALAARGYFEAFQAIKKTVMKILEVKQNPGEILEEDLQEWYQKLFSPSVQAGLISPHQLLGYRNHPIYIRGSRHVPPPPEAMVDTMEALVKHLKEEPEASVRAILGHYIFVFIHPYFDGNGRIARFLMNVMLTSGHYPWVVIPLTRRNEYMSALASIDSEHNIIPFTKLIMDLMR